MAAAAAPSQFVHAFPLDGTWYDPAHNGEGWIVEVLPDDSAVVYWFTFPPPGGSGEQAWILGTGRVNGNRIEITESIITRGPAFGAAYDVADFDSEPWGTWVMQFSDCNSGELSYQGPSTYGSGRFTLGRLTHLQGSGCVAGEPSDAARTGFSGSWFEPASNGQGVTLEILADGAALIYWFTYTPSGDQAWVFGRGRADGPRLEFPQVFMPVGTVFGGDFDAGAVDKVAWGALSLTFDTCDAGVLNYRSDLTGWGTGFVPIVRLTGLAAHPCKLPPAPPLTQGRWLPALPMRPAVSEIATTVLDGKAYTAGDFSFHPNAFLRFNPASGRTSALADLPEPRHHAMLVAHQGSLYLFGGYEPLAFNATDTVWQYLPNRGRWTEFTTMPGPMAAAAAVSLGDSIYVVTTVGIVWRLDPDTRLWTILDGPDTVNRDHANAVAFRGEIWWLGGRNPFDGPLNSVDIFDPITGVWRRGPSLLRPHSGFAAAVVQGQLMVAGGENPVFPFTRVDLWTVEPSLEVYYPPDEHWRRGPDLPVPVHGVGGGALNGRFYLLGGSTQAGGADNPGIIQVYDPES